MAEIERLKLEIEKAPFRGTRLADLFPTSKKRFVDR